MLIPPSVLKGVSAAASKDPARWQLLGVFVERIGERTCAATATDGIIMLSALIETVGWKRGDGPSCTVSIDSGPDGRKPLRFEAERDGLRVQALCVPLVEKK